MRTDLPASVVGMAFPSLDLDPGSLAMTGISFAMAIALIVYTLVLLNRRPEGRLAEGGPTGNGRGAGSTEDAAGEGGASGHDASGGGASGHGASGGGVDWAGRFALSAREEQVVDLLLHGYTLPQLADKLGISLNTVRWYTKGIYRKLAIHSKAELIELAETLRREG